MLLSRRGPLWTLLCCLPSLQPSPVTMLLAPFGCSLKPGCLCRRVEKTPHSTLVVGSDLTFIGGCVCLITSRGFQLQRQVRGVPGAFVAGPCPPCWGCLAFQGISRRRSKPHPLPAFCLPALVPEQTQLYLSCPSFFFFFFP